MNPPMPYQAGFAALRARLIRFRDRQAVSQLDALESDFRQLLSQGAASLDNTPPAEMQRILDRLDKLAYRTVATSFVSLCGGETGQPEVWRPSFLSLRAVFQFVVVLLLLPGLVIALVSYAQQGNDQREIEQIEQKAQAIDRLVASGVFAPFYLSSFDPCSPGTRRHLRMTGVRVDLDQSRCAWIYTDTATQSIILKDYWKAQTLVAREYFANERLLVSDSYDRDSEECFKSRTYFDEAGRELGKQCFSEAGVARAPELRDRLKSPIPPPFYWFFYR